MIFIDNYESLEFYIFTSRLFKRLKGGEWMDAINDAVAKPAINMTVYKDLSSMLPDAVGLDELGAESTVTDLARFVAWCENTLSTGQPGIAWHLGQRCDYRQRGILGEVVFNTGTLGAGLHWLVHFYPLVQDATNVKLDVHGDVATISYRIIDPNIWPRHQDALYTLGVFSTLIRAADGGAWAKIRILLEASQHDVRADLCRVVRAPVAYNAQTNAISFPASLLDKRLNGKHERISQQHIIQLSQALTKKNRSMSVTERVRYKILADLADSQASQEQVARQLGLSSRTLRRKLSFEGHSYQELLDECRMQLAVREFTTSPCVSLSQMALKLGYTEHSTFTRAFGRWSGVAPKEYRIAAVDFKDKGAFL